jgi:serine/threonine protein kinase/Tfp pilus assembly protein PilF
MAYSADDLARPGSEPVPGFRLLQRIGRGGIGEVWKAEGPGGFPVAFKFIRLSEDGGAAELRALEISRTIRHPNLLGSFGAWVVGDLLVIGMELADRALWDRFREAIAEGHAGIPREELLGYLAGAARGIDYLNESRHSIDGKESVGVQHRDIKPQNILLFGGGVKVADFGQARLLNLGVSTRTGIESWTFAYAAPELFRNQAAQQSDQYSLAVTYCQLRAGRVPFSGSAEEVMAGHLLSPPELSMLPKEERPVVERALAKTPADRWPSCSAFVEAVCSTATALHSRRAVTANGISARERPTHSGQATAVGANSTGRLPLETTLVPEGEPTATAPDLPSFDLPEDATPLASPLFTRARLRAAGVALAVLCSLLLVIGGFDAPIQCLRGVASSTAKAWHGVGLEAGGGRTRSSSQEALAIGPQSLVLPPLDASTKVPPPPLEEVESEPSPPSLGPEVRLRAPAPGENESPAASGVELTAALGPHLPMWSLRNVESQKGPPTLEGPLEVAPAAPERPTGRRHSRNETAQKDLEKPESTTVPGTTEKVALNRPSVTTPSLPITDAPEPTNTPGPFSKQALNLATEKQRGLSEVPDGSIIEPEAAPKRSALNLEAPPTLIFQAGRTATLPIAIHRQGLEGPVTVRFEGAPEGMTMEPVTLSPGAESATTSVSVTADAEVNEREVTIVASSESATSETRVKVSVKPDPALALLRDAKAQLDKGEVDRAIESFTELIRLDPDSVVAYSSRASAFHKKGDYNRAIADYTSAIRLKPDDPVLCNNRGLAYREQGEYYKAISDYTEALRLKPGDALVYYNRGLARLRLGDTLDAITDFTEAIRLRPDYADAYRHRSDAYNRRGDFTRAQGDLDMATRLENKKQAPKAASKRG